MTGTRDFDAAPGTRPALALPFVLRTGAGGLPRILSALIGRLDEYLSKPAACLPGLNGVNDNGRQQRVERRVACIQLLRAHAKYLDLASLRVGVPQADGGFLSLTLGFLARQAGLGLRRAERAMRDLLDAGLVRSQQRCTRDDDGHYRGLAALRQLPAGLFDAFGLGRWLKHERSKAVMRRSRAQAAAVKTEREARRQAQGSLIMGGLQHRIQRAKGAPRIKEREHHHGMTRNHAIDFELEARRRVGLLLMANPGWDRDACYAQAYRELGAGAPSPAVPEPAYPFLNAS